MEGAGADDRQEKSERGGLIRFILAVALVAWLFRSLIFTPFTIPSGSMLPNLMMGDYVLASKWPYGYSRFSFPFDFPPIEGRILADIPERGDVVVFRHPGGENMDVVKRVIGLPGDTVEVRDGELTLNGKPIPRTRVQPFAMPVSANSPCRTIDRPQIRRTADGEEQCLYPAFRETLPGGISYTVLDQVQSGPGDYLPPTRVPAGQLFVMGDNRDDSLDSRFDPLGGGLGFVPFDRLIGRGERILWSSDGSADYLRPWTWFSALRSERVGRELEQGGE